MKKIMLLLSKVTCIMAMALAVLSVNSTCGFTAYQPDVPESLEHKSNGSLIRSKTDYYQAIGG